MTKRYEDCCGVDAGCVPERSEFLSVKYAHPRDKRICFDPGIHRYSLPSSGYVFRRSVTAFVGKYFSKFDTTIADRRVGVWAADPSSKYYEFISNVGIELAAGAIKRMWRENGAMKANLGTLMHACIETLVNNNDNLRIPVIEKSSISSETLTVSKAAEKCGVFGNPSSSEISERSLFLASEEISLVLAYAKEVNAGLSKVNPEFSIKCSPIHNPQTPKEILGFFNWRERTRWILEPIRTEWSVFSKTLTIAGQIDAVYRYIDGPKNEVVIVDWKRIADIREEDSGYCKKTATAPFSEFFDESKEGKYSFQLNVYALILEAEYGLTVKELRVVQFSSAIPEDEGYFRETKIPKIDLEIIRSELAA